MAALCQQAILAGDGSERSGFRGRIYVAMVAAAVAVQGEAAGAAVAPTGTLSAGSLVGATTVSSSVSIPANTLIRIDVGALAEFVTTTGAPSGAGPFTIPVPALTQAHSSGVAITAITTSVVYQKRQALATAVLANPLAYLERFAIGAASNSTIGGDISAPVAITSSTAVNPSVITTAVVHGLTSGDTVQIVGHLTNTALNGQWVATVITTTTFSVPVLGIGVGSGGTVTRQPSDANIANFGPFAQWNKFAGVTALD